MNEVESGLNYGVRHPIECAPLIAHSVFATTHSLCTAADVIQVRAGGGSLAFVVSSQGGGEAGGVVWRGGAVRCERR